MKGSKLQLAVHWSLGLFFISPYLAFLYYFKPQWAFDSAELLWAVKNTVFQALLAAVFCTCLAVPLSLGWLSFKPKMRQIVGQLLLLPQIFPVLFSVLIAFQIWNPFPLGAVGVVFVYVLINLGLATVLVGRSIMQRAAQESVVAEVFAIGRWRYYRQVLWPRLRGELLAHLLIIFIFCFTSFSVPLAAGGGRDINLEILIYEKIFIDFDWSAAFFLSLGQTVLVLLLSFSVQKLQSENQIQLATQPGNYLRWSGARLGVLAYLIVYIGGYLVGLGQGLRQLSFVSEHASLFFTVMTNTLSLLGFYLIFNLILLYAWAYDFVLNQKIHWLRHLLSPSTAVVGLTFFILLPPHPQSDGFKITMAMSVLIFPLLFKLFLERPLVDLKPQLRTAEVFGLSAHRVIYQILYRQLRSPLLLWLAFLVLWFVSDFAVSKSVGAQTETLGQLTHSFLGSYRLSLAYVSSFLILLISALVMALCYLLMVVGDVAHKKFKS